MSSDESKPGLSRVLCAITAIVFATGLLSGVISTLNSDNAPVTHLPDTNAWGVHLVITVLTLVLIVAVWAVRRRGGRSRTPLILTPLGVRAEHRLRRTVRVSPLRMIPVVLLLVFAGYGVWRAGMQVFGGIDPDFVTNAWGGPSYLGAMYCHYLDGGLMIAAALFLVHLLLVPVSSDEPESDMQRGPSV